MTQVTDLHSGLNTRAVAYDALDRLATANGSWGAGTFDYDGLDNLRASTVGTRTLAHQYDQATQRLTALSGSLNLGFGYDVQGNITSRGSQGFQFDIANRMTRAVGKAEYVYDGNGRRAWAWNSDGSHRGHAYAQDGQLLITGDPRNGDAWHVHLGGRHIREIEQRDGRKHLYTDFLGSLVGRGTPAEGPQEWTRTRYEPYGRVSSGAQPFNVGYTGHVNDPDTGLIQMQQRYYEPLAGRFLSVDPVVTDANTGSDFNRHAYVGNNPYGFTR